MATANEILVVDDEIGIRELLSEILEDEGYTVKCAENAGEARAYRNQSRPAMVLLAIWMPDTDGITLLREWAAAGQLTMPVVMLSAQLGQLGDSDGGAGAAWPPPRISFLLPRSATANLSDQANLIL